MQSHGTSILLLGMAVSALGCSGSYQVGSEPMPASGGAAGSSVSASGGADTTPGGSVAVAGAAVGGGAAGGGVVDPLPGSRCAFTPETPTDSPAAAPSVVLARITRFLDDDSSNVSGATLPAKATAAWAEEQAMSILDAHASAETEAPGLFRFLKGWLRLSLPAADTDVSAAHGWSLKLVQPNATLSTLLADPTGEPHRVGILTDQQVLAARPTIPRRGAWMMEKLFCMPVPPPPVGVSPLDPDTAMGVTRRQKLENAVSGPTCKACHELTSPPGDSLEHFDEQGNYRELDNGEAVDSSGTITRPATMSFIGIEQLSPQLATSCDVAHCFSEQLMTDASGVAPPDMPSFTAEEVNHVANAFADSAFSIRALVKAVVSSPSFMH
jgi:hypothetical protein